MNEHDAAVGLAYALMFIGAWWVLRLLWQVAVAAVELWLERRKARLRFAADDLAAEFERQRKMRAFVDRTLPVDPASDAMVEAYAADRERVNPLPRRPIPWKRGEN